VATVSYAWKPSTERCDNCWSVICWEMDDVHVETPYGFYITCPSCNTRVGLSKDQLPPIARQAAKERSK
jgi:hypothetical protein